MYDNKHNKYRADAWGFVEITAEIPTGLPEEPWNFRSEIPTGLPEEPW
jgi:hypothetical protein